MKGKTFLVLLVAAAVLVGLAFIRFSDRQQAVDTNMGQKLFADLPVNRVARVTIADAGSSVVLVKGDKTWQVQERDGYPADFDQLRDVVVKLSRLKIGRSFTGSEKSLVRLSLLAPSAESEEGRGTRMTLEDSSGEVLADVILGQTRQTEGGGSGGQYLKKMDSDTVFLVDGSFRFLKTAPSDWLDDEILDIKADDVASVACYAGSGTDPVFTLTRPGKGEAPQMTPVPSGRSVDTAKIEQVFDALAPLTLDDVAAADEKNINQSGADARKLIYRLYDGRQITLFPESDGKENYRVRVTAEQIQGQTADTDAVGTGSTVDGDDQPDTGSGADAADAEAQADAPQLKTAEQINAELRPWVFSIKKWQYDSLATQPDALLENVAENTDKAS